MSKKKRYIVVPRTEAIKQSGLKTGKGKLTFGRKTAQWVDDPAVAQEINTEYGLKGSGDVWVEQDENLEWHERHDGMTDGRNTKIHHYTFAGVDMTGIRITRDNGYVWVRVGDGREKRVKREVAIANGWRITKKKRNQRRKGAEVAK